MFWEVRPQFDASSRLNEGCPVERRRTTRYGLRVPVSFSWKNLRGNHQWAEGVSRDICTNGVFVCAEQAPPVGAAIRVHVRFPKVDKKAALEMHAEGHVLRVEPASDPAGQIGFAFVCKSFVLLSGESARESAT